MTPKAIAPGSLLSLAERVESLDGPDRDIDTEILWHINRGAFSRGYWNAASGMPRPLEQMPSKNGGLGWIGAQCCAPTYTASLDAAMTLVPKGMGDELLSIMMKRGYLGETDVLLLDTLTGADWTAMSINMPAAVTAAALKARAHQSGEQA